MAMANEAAVTKTSLHLICNAHLDPVWLWEWQEGAAAALSTFRTAADLCEEFDGFVFNHNEAVLYEWVAEYEPALFARIQKLVKRGRWHIMGGWFLQPDCNMPAGESLVRQIAYGRRYFQRHFGARPTTAINFDSFGHTRGLVQIMAKSGYDSYIYCRPPIDQVWIPADNYRWVGYDGSEVICGRAYDMYLSALGKADEKVRKQMTRYDGRVCAFTLWGVGNHGGGPSREDLKKLAVLMKQKSDFNVRHSTPEAYFKELKAAAARGDVKLPPHAKDLNPIMVGCYTSMSRIKRRFRELENEFYATEKMAAVSGAQSLINVKAARAELAAAERDLLFAQFHDILPGSAIAPVEEMALRVMDHGLEILSRLKTRCFFALCAGQKKVRINEVPVIVYNPHPYPVETIVECEYQLQDQNYSGTFTDAVAVDARGRELPTQIEHEASNLPIDWRKRVVFKARLEPSRINRFDCKLIVKPKKPAPQLTPASNGVIRFRNGEGLEVLINTHTGLVDKLAVGGKAVLAENALQPIVIKDDEDPWGMRKRQIRKKLGGFKLMNPQESARFSGVAAEKLPGVRVIEDGPVRSVVEVTLAWGESRIAQRYLLPRHGTAVQVQMWVYWNEKDRMLKLALPLAEGFRKGAAFRGQVAYGVGELPDNGDEAVAQKWLAVVGNGGKDALTVINDGTYGSDFDGRELRLNLLRSAAYAAHPIDGRPILPQDRFTPRIDQGERHFRFWIDAGPAAQRLQAIDREALVCNEVPMALSFFPSGGGKMPKQGPVLSDNVVQMAALKEADSGDGLIVRLFNPTERPRATTLAFPAIGLRPQKLRLGKFEIKTLRLSRAGALTETDLMEKPLTK